MRSGRISLKVIAGSERATWGLKARFILCCESENSGCWPCWIKDGEADGEFILWKMLK